MHEKEINFNTSCQEIIDFINSTKNAYAYLPAPTGGLSENKLIIHKAEKLSIIKNEYPNSNNVFAWRLDKEEKIGIIYRTTILDKDAYVNCLDGVLKITDYEVETINEIPTKGISLGLKLR